MLSKIPMGRFGTVDEIAGVVTWAASEDCGFTTGSVFDASGRAGDLLIRAAFIPTHGPRFRVKWRENRRAWRLRGKPLKRLRFLGLESGWKVAGKWLATF